MEGTLSIHKDFVAIAPLSKSLVVYCSYDFASDAVHGDAMVVCIVSPEAFFEDDDNDSDVPFVRDCFVGRT